MGTARHTIDMAAVRERLASGESKTSIARDLGIPRRSLCHRIDNPHLDNLRAGDSTKHKKSALTTVGNNLQVKPLAAKDPGLKTVPGDYGAVKKEGEKTHQQENDDGTQTLSSTGSRIKNVRQLLEACGVDTDYWEPYDGIVQSYEGMRKDVKKDLEFEEGRISGYVYDEGKLHVETLYKIRVKLRKRKEKTLEELAQVFRSYLEDREPANFTKFVNVTTDSKTEDENCIDLEIATTDVHCGMLAWGKETRDASWNTDKAVAEYIESSLYLVKHAECFGKIRSITIPFGNDFFNSDNAKQKTHAGTDQHDDTRWQNSFAIGSDAVCQLGEILGARYNVEMLLVQGNHDWERSFYLGEKLRSHFRNTPSVKVDNEPCAFKYRLHGCTLVGYEHGHGPKEKQQGLLMADTAPAEMWARARFKEWHHGHVHHERTLDDGRVTLRWFRALCPLSSWAAKMGYRGIRSAVACMYHPTRGPLDQYNWFPATCKGFRQGLSTIDG